MSISTFQEKVLKGGCGPVFLIGCAAVMAVSMFYSCSLGDRTTGGPTRVPDVALTVGQTPITEDQLSDSVRRLEDQQRQYRPNSGPLSPREEAGLLAFAVKQLVQSAAQTVIAQRNGVKLEDDALLRAAEVGVRDSLQTERMKLQMGGQLKPNATDKDWADYVKKAAGVTPEELQKRQVDEIRARLSSPGTRSEIVMSLTPLLLKEALSSKYPVSDAQLQKSYDRVTYKKILIKTGLPGRSADARAEEALRAVRGGTSFEKAIDRFSNELPSGTQPLSVKTETATGASLIGDPAQIPLADLAVGKTSGIVPVTDGKAIYKVTARKAELPKDFATKKETYRREVQGQLVSAEIQRQVEAIQKDPKLVTIALPGLKAFMAITDDMSASPVGLTSEDSLKKVRANLDAAKAVLKKAQGFDLRAAALAVLTAASVLDGAPGGKPDATRDDRIEATMVLLQTSEDVNVRLELVDQLVAAGKKDEAAEQLLAAAQANSVPDDTGQGNYARIAAKLRELDGKKVVNAELKKMIEAEQRRWLEGKVEADKFAAEQKKADEEAKKKAEAEAKKPAAKKP